MKRIITIISITLLLIVTITLEPVSTSGSIYASDKEYSGEEYFRGIVFGQGEVAVKLTGLYSKDEAKILDEVSEDEEYLTAVNEIVEYVKENEPNLFGDFKSSIENQDPNALTNSLNKTESLILKYSENGHFDYDTNACSPLFCGVVVGVIVVAAVHLVVLASQVSGAAIAVGTWVVVPDGKSNAITDTEHISYLVLTSLNK